MRPVAVCCLVLLVSSPAAADVLHLVGGGRLDGAVTRSGEFFEVRDLLGSARIAVDRVLRIESGDSPVEEYERRRAAIRDPDAAAHFRLGLWLDGRGASGPARREFRAAIAADPDFAPARRALGYVRFRDEWMTREEARVQGLLDAGLVEHDDRWFSPDGLRAYLTAKAEKAELEARLLADAANAEEEAAAEPAPAEADDPPPAQVIEIRVHLIEEIRVFSLPVGFASRRSIRDRSGARPLRSPRTGLPWGRPGPIEAAGRGGSRDRDQR